VNIWQSFVYGLEIQNQIGSFKDRISESLSLDQLESEDTVECQLCAVTEDRFGS
jgi:hypothetical protein